MESKWWDKQFCRQHFALMNCFWLWSIDQQFLRRPAYSTQLSHSNHTWYIGRCVYIMLYHSTFWWLFHNMLFDTFRKDATGQTTWFPSCRWIKRSSSNDSSEFAGVKNVNWYSKLNAPSNIPYIFNILLWPCYHSYSKLYTLYSLSK